jgi:hypothetical protein
MTLGVDDEIVPYADQIGAATDAACLEHLGPKL